MSRERIEELFSTFDLSGIVKLHGENKYSVRKWPKGLGCGTVVLAECCGSIVLDSLLDYDKGSMGAYIDSRKIIAVSTKGSKFIDDEIKINPENVKSPLYPPEDTNTLVSPTKYVIEDKNPLTLYYWDH